MTTTKAKCEFYYHMGRHTSATPGQVQRLLRYAATLQRLAEQECNSGLTPDQEIKQVNIRGHVLDICKDINEAMGIDDRIDPLYKRPPCCRPIFSGDPRGCVLKIRVPDGFTDDWGKEGICVPA